jgi:hypothetical protein
VLFTKDMTKLVAVPASLQGAYAIPASVTAIGLDAFSGCSDLTSITLPSGLTEIGSCAFSECYGLTTIEIPAGVTLAVQSLEVLSDGKWKVVDSPKKFDASAKGLMSGRIVGGGSLRVLGNRAGGFVVLLK